MEFEAAIETSGNLVKVPVGVNGQGPFIFTLDTGASTTTLTKKLAAQLGIEIRTGNRSDARGIGGGMPTEFADASINLGALEFEEDEVYVLALDSILRCAGEHGGVLGYTTLKHCTMSLSYSKKRFKLSKGSSSLDLDWGKFHYINDSHLIGIPVHVNGRGPYEFVLDTGAGNSVITPELASKLGLEAKEFPGIARGIGGDVQLKLAPVDTLSVGGAQITNTQLVVLDLSLVSPRGKLIENGIIGYDFLRTFETVIDYPKQQFSFIDEHNS
ncbi:MAG: retropepsin-like aspartic protease [Candidatus Thorarchaeota archaeon]